MRRHRQRLARVLAAVAVIGTAAAPGAALSAQTRDDDDGVLRLVDQTTWVREDQRFNVRVGIDTRRPPRRLELALTVFGRVPFRSSFAQTVNARGLGSVLAHETVPITEATALSDGTLTVTVVPPLRRAGVHPVRVELRDVNDEEPLARLTTHLIHVPDDTYAAPLRTSWIVPIDASPATQTNGEMRIRSAQASGLSSLGQALQARPRLAASLLPAPETLDALAAGSKGSPERAALTALSRGVAGRTLLGSTYVPVELRSLLDGDLEREADSQLARGIATADRLLGRAPRGDTWVARGPLDGAAVEWLRARGFNRFVVSDDTLSPVRLPTTLTGPFELAVPDGDRPLAAAIDAGLSAHFEADEQAVVAAHRLLADLSVIYFDHPGREGRGVVVAPPRGWQPNAEFLAAFLSGLADSPILASATIDDYFDTVPPATSRGDALVRRLQAGDADRELPTTALQAARRRLDSFATLLEEDNGRHLDFEKLLLAAQTQDLSRNRRSAYVRGFHEAIDAELGLVEIPDRQSIRLTARDGDIPVPILSRTGYPVRVLVRVEGDTVDFPDGGDRLVSLVHETTTERVPVQARSSGAFPLRVTVFSPDGGLALATSRFTVTSTAASWVGLVLSAGAALVLVVWWGRHVHGRRSGKLVPT